MKAEADFYRYERVKRVIDAPFVGIIRIRFIGYDLSPREADTPAYGAKLRHFRDTAK